MTAPVLGAARVGRDPNDATWTVVRYPADWADAALRGIIHDARGGALILAPEVDPARARWLPVGPVEDTAGDAWRADPATHRLLRRKACAQDWETLAGVGGHGWRTGRLDTPLGVTVDPRGWLLLADSGNHRVQVVEPAGGAVVAVLGATDRWGRPVPGEADGAMREPVHVAVDPRTCHLFVADREAGLIHIFDERFRHVRSVPPWTGEASGTDARPLAVAVAGDGTLLVLDAARPRLVRMTPEGRPLGEEGISGLETRFPGLPLRPRFRPEGDVIVGPVDGDVHDLRWHRVVLEAEVPSGTRLHVQTFASNDDGHAPDTLPWAPARPVPVPQEATEGGNGEFERLVVGDRARWRRWRESPYRREDSVVVAFDGDGPHSGDEVEVPWDRARLLRAGDSVALEAGEAEEAHTVTSVPATDVTFTATGDARAYGPGAELLLVEREGRPLPGAPRVMHTFGAAQSADLSGVDVSGRSSTASLPHAVAALLGPGDAARLREGPHALDLRVESVADGLPVNAAGEATVTVTLDSTVAGDFSSGRLRLTETPGRLVADRFPGFEVHPVLHEAVSVVYHPDPRSERTEEARVLLADPETRTLWLEPGTLSAAGNRSWVRFSFPEPSATDRGRYLWIRLRLSGRRERRGDGHAVATPRVRSVRVLRPRLSYLSYLPATYGRTEPRHDPPGSGFLERFLALFEGELTRVEEAYESVSRLLDPAAADEEWLRFVSAWLDLVFDPSWPVERRRTLVLEAFELFRRRGTPEAIRRYVEIYTGRAPTLVEGFQRRPSSSLVVGRTGRLGCSALGSEVCEHGSWAHRFTLGVVLDDDCDREDVEGPVRAIVESMTPAHVQATLRFDPPRTRVGVASRVGLDTVLGQGEDGSFLLGRDAASPATSRPSLVGFDRLAGSRSPTPIPDGGTGGGRPPSVIPASL